MRKSILLSVILLCIGCQKQPASDQAPAGTVPAPEAAVPAAAEAPTIEAPAIEETKPETALAPEQAQAPAEPTVDEKCKDIACGVHQTCVEGQCTCGGVALSPQDAASWECVDDRFRCYRAEGCAKEGAVNPQSTVLEPPKDDANAAIPPKIPTEMADLIPLDPKAEYPIVAPIKPLPYSDEYTPPGYDDSMDITEIKGDNRVTGYCDGAPCDGICRNNLCYDEPGDDFVLETISSGSGDGGGDPDDSTWVCDNMEGCKAKYGTYYVWGESFAPTGKARMTEQNNYIDEITNKYPQYQKCLDDISFFEFEDLYNRHFEIPNQFVCNDNGEFVCKLDKCCCGKGECAKGEICTSSGKCEGNGKHDPTPAVCGAYAKQVPPKEGEYRPDYDKMCQTDGGCKCGSTICAKAAECHNGSCFCAGVISPGNEYECKQGQWKCTDPEKCPPEQLYKQPVCGQKKRIGDGYVCRLIVDPDVPRPVHDNPYVDDDDPHYDKYEWQCGLSGGCACGQGQCGKGEACIDGVCYCGRKRALAAPGWACESGKLVCAQDEGCDCAGYTKNKGDSCFIQANLFADENEYKDKPHPCGDVICPQRTRCIQNQCLFFSTPQRLSNPQEYVSNWGFPQCNRAEGCACGELRCQKGEFCHQNRCLKNPTSVEIDGHTVEYVPVEIEQLQYHPYSGHIRKGDIVFIPRENEGSSEDWSFGYQQDRAFPYQFTKEIDGDESLDNHSGVDFVQRYGFERYYRNTQYKATCRGVPYPKNSSGFACIVGVVEETKEYGNVRYISYFPNEIGWLCSQKDGCACGEAKCGYKQTCIDGQCQDFTWIKHVSYIHETDYETDDHIGGEITTFMSDHDLCGKAEGCPCGETRCYKGGRCYYNEYCEYRGHDIDYTSLSNGGCASERSNGIKINDNGTCIKDKYLYEPHLYLNHYDLGLECIQEKCPCGEVQCDKGHFCAEPGRCI